MSKSIDLSPLANHEPMLRPSGPAAPEREPELWQTDFAARFAAARATRASNLLAQALQSRLTALDTAIAALDWPENATASTRLAVPDADHIGSVRATLREGDQALPEDRLVSRGFSTSRSSPVAAGDYELTLSLGRDEERLGVSVAKGATARDVLASVAAAVNAAGLPVEAQVVTQAAPGQRLAGSVGRGDLLVLSVNEGLGSGELTLGDAEGHLAEALGLTETPRAVGPASLTRYDLRKAAPATPTTYVSRDFDPGATTDLPAGTYTVTVTRGSASRDVTVPVATGQTWAEVLATLQNRLNASQDMARAKRATVERRSYDPRLADMVSRQRTELTVTATPARTGERLRLSEDASASPDGATGLLARLGLTVTAAPGADGRLTVDGRAAVRSPAHFVLDDGRLALDVEAPFRDSRSLTVTTLGRMLPGALRTVLAAYTDLAALLHQDPELFDPGLTEVFVAKTRDAAASLAGDGLDVLAQGRAVRLDPGRFEAALAADPGGLRQRLAGADGLVTTWAAATRAALAAGTDSLVAPATAFAARLDRADKALDNRFSALLLDLLG